MARTVYRVCRARYARLSGEGAKIAGGRWNSPGRAVVYMAESVSLAVLENLVHMSVQDFPTGYVCVTAVLPGELRITGEQELRLRADLKNLSPQALGDWWLESKASAVLEVSSVVIPSEHNYVLNPAHPDFASIVVDPPALFHFDPRLFR
jgi:RES domain-containing protein